MEIRIHDGSGGNEWALGWTKRFAAALPTQLETAAIQLHVSGKSQASLHILHHDLKTLCTLSTDRTVEPEHKAADYAEWFTSEEQTALFREAQERRDEPMTVERVGALAVASRIDGAAYRDALLCVIATSTARYKKGRAHIAIGLNCVSPVHGVAVRARKDQPPLVRVRDKAFRITDLSYTPQIEMHLPQVILDAMMGQPLDRFVDHPVVTGAGFMVDHVTTVRSNGRNPSRTTFHLRSARIGVDEAVALIDQRRQTMTSAINMQGE